MQERALRAPRHEQLADFAIRLHVGTAETVDRLLRIADDEELARDGMDLAPVGLSAIVRREQQEDLRLERIGVLEFVHEQAGETRLKRLAHFAVLHEQIARSQQQVDEVERAGPLLQVRRNAQ